MSEIAKFKLNLKTGEIEVEGSEAFVERQIQTLENLVELMELRAPTDEAKDVISTGEQDSVDDKSGSGTVIDDKLPNTFGEWMHTFRTDINDLDKALITARFVQSQSPSNDFKTAEVNKALKDHGIKLSNPSGSLKRLVEKKLMFQTRKVGVLKFVRVSVDGQKHLLTLKRQD